MRNTKQLTYAGVRPFLGIGFKAGFLQEEINKILQRGRTDVTYDCRNIKIVAYCGFLLERIIMFLSTSIFSHCVR